VAALHPSPQETKGGSVMLDRLMKAIEQLEDSWVADVLGVICLFALIPVFLVVGLVSK
jgi:hypothetical protein